jgi:hypothetical protein
MLSMTRWRLDIRHLGTVLYLFAACRAPASHAAEQNVSPGLAPDLRLQKALADTGKGRVYFAGEVAKPAAPHAGLEMPRTFGLPDGELRLFFVVDSSGRFESGAYAHQGPIEFAQAVLKVLPSWRFYPAAPAAGAPVRQLVLLRMVKRGNGAEIRVDPVTRP